MPSSRLAFFLLFPLLATACAELEEQAQPCDGVSGNCVVIPANASESDIQKALILASPGDTIAFSAGKYDLEKGLTLDVPDVTLKGMGSDKSVLSFAAQSRATDPTSGAKAQGLLVKSDNFTMVDLAIEDTAGDALKVEGTTGLIIRRSRVEWTNGPDPKNGAYGFYPVLVKDVLIENSVAIGASDAGIYVGQSENIIVRGNRAEYNVAGIEIENSIDADVFDNVAQNNTGGILVFSLPIPATPIPNGKNIRVFGNVVQNNNTNNFAPEGNIVGFVPTGTGVMLMAANNIEVFDNHIRDNAALNVLIVSYLATDRGYDVDEYYPYPEKIYIHDNKFTGGGDKPGGTNTKKKPGDVAALGVQAFVGIKPIPDIVWDGYQAVTSTTSTGELEADAKICFQDNETDKDTFFVDIDYGNNFQDISTDLATHTCSHKPVGAVTLP